MTLRLDGNVPPTEIEIFLKHECYRFLSILLMGNLPPPSLPTYISRFSKTVKRKPLIFNFKWNFGWILGQHDTFELEDVPTTTPNPNPRITKKFLSEVRFELANVPPHPQD